jgi:hypothetical protein
MSTFSLFTSPTYVLNRCNRGGFPDSYLATVDDLAIEIKHGVAPKIGRLYSQTCDDVGATHKHILYGGDNEFPVGRDV